MEDDMLWRIKMDIALPKNADAYADQIRAALVPFLQYGVVINEGLPHEERGYIHIERDGHELGLECIPVARWEVGLGRVL